MKEPRRRSGRTSQTLLLDIYQRLCVVETQNTQILEQEGRSADSRSKIYQAQDAIRGDLIGVKGELKAVSDRVKSMEPDVVKMKGFRTQIAVAVMAVTSIVTGAVNLIWIGLTHISEIKAAIRNFLR